MLGIGPTILTIAGSDSGGGAGIQADLKTFAANECYGTSVITALTSQNTKGVQGVHGCPPEFVGKQITSIFDDFEVRAIKTGMLYDAATAHEVAQLLNIHLAPPTTPPLVCDPVCVSTSGHSLLHEDAIHVLVKEIFPLATLITPNKSEAELLLSHMDAKAPIDSLEGMLSAAKALASKGRYSVLLKGGHQVVTMREVVALQNKYDNINIIKHDLPQENMEIIFAGRLDYDSMELVADVLYQNSGALTLFVRPRIQTTSTHGTGCTLSSAIASELGKGVPLEQAVDKATMYTYHGILSASPIGHGHGPLNHFHRLAPTLISLPTKTSPYPFTQMLIESDLVTWKAYVEHDFVRQLGAGILDRAKFIHFVKQDYHYLKYYARAYALLAAKRQKFDQIDDCMRAINSILLEIGSHREYCATFGITAEELEITPEATATTAYGAYIMDVGLQGDAIKLIMSLMACLLGYGEVGLWLKKQSTLPNTWAKLEGNPYQHWIEEYSGELYQASVKRGLATLEAYACDDPPSLERLNEWKAIWQRCTKLEKGFWDMAMELRY